MYHDDSFAYVGILVARANVRLVLVVVSAATSLTSSNSV